MSTCVPWEKQLWYWHGQESVAEVFFPSVCVLKEFLTDCICTQYIPICVCKSWTVLESSRIHLFPKELCLDQIGFMCACRSAETLLAGCGSFPRLPWFNGIQAFSNRTAVAWGESRCFSHWIFVGLAGSWAFPLLSLAWNYYNIYYLYVFQWTLLCPRKQISFLYFTQRAITPRKIWAGLNATYLFLH